MLCTDYVGSLSDAHGMAWQMQTTRLSQAACNYRSRVTIIRASWARTRNGAAADDDGGDVAIVFRLVCVCVAA